MIERKNKNLVIWHFRDGKPGHENQVSGLIHALAKKVPLTTYPLVPLSTNHIICHLLIKKRSVCLPGPNFILGAGHQTHLSLLAAKRVYGGKTVILMKPTLPICFFDLCIIPEHDAPPKSANVLVTRGVLNEVCPSQQLKLDLGLILIGGRSNHFKWDSEALVNQIKTIVLETPNVRFTLMTSRRTPPEFLDVLEKQVTVQLSSQKNNHLMVPPFAKNPHGGILTVIPFEQTTRDWLLNEFNRCGEAWVTPDSVSMVFEALTAGAKVGVFDFAPFKKKSRVQGGLTQLITSQMVQPFGAWQKTKKLFSHPPINEAERCAEWMVQEWLNSP